MEKKDEKFEWKYVGYFFIALACLFVVVFLINVLIRTEAPFKVAQDNDWIGFWGGIVASILSGIITFIVLKITIDNESTKRLEDKREIEFQRLEDKRMSIIPYLTYYIADDTEQITKKLKSPLMISPKNNYGYTNEDGLIDKNKIARFTLVIENTGLGVAIEPSIKRIMYDGITNMSSGVFRNLTTLNMGEKAIIDFRVIGTEENTSDLTIKIGYFNLLRDYYQQEIVIGLGGTVFYDQEKGKSTIMKYEKGGIIKISKAIITEEPSDSEFFDRQKSKKEK